MVMRGRAAPRPPSTTCCTRASGRGGTSCAPTSCGSGTARRSGGPLALRLRGADPSPEGTGSEGSAANASGSEGSAANSGGSFGSVASGMGLDSPTPTETVNVLLGPGVFAGQQPQVLVPGG